MDHAKDKIEYLKNELRSYKEIERRCNEGESFFNGRIAFYQRKLKEVADELNAGNGKGIDYSYVPTTAVHEPVLNLLCREEKLKANLDFFIEKKEAELKGFKIRLEYMDQCLSKLDGWEREFVEEYYINHVRIDKLEAKLGRSRSRLFEDKEKVIRKMLLS